MKVQSAYSGMNLPSHVALVRNAGHATEARAAPPLFNNSSDIPSKLAGGESEHAAHTAQLRVPPGYASKPAGELHADPVASGVLRDGKAQSYISQDNQTFPVRYDQANATWRIFSPENPTKYQYPVRRDERGDWHQHGEVGLPGGSGGGNRQGVGGSPHGALPPHLQARQQQLQNERQDLLQQRNDLDNQLRQFPTANPLNQPGGDMAHMRQLVQEMRNFANLRLQNVDQELQQLQNQQH